MNGTQVSPRIVGRDDELARIDGMMAGRDGPWLLFVKAPGGEGKSRLLETVLEKYRALDHPTSGLFDFFTDGHRTREGVLSALAGRNHFRLSSSNAFHAHMDRYEAAVMAGHDAGRRKALDDAEAALVKSLLSRFKKRRGLIVVDTVEQISRLKLSGWFFGKFLSTLAPNAVVLAGGREVPQGAVEELGDRCRVMELGGLSAEAVEAYLRQVVTGFADDPEAPAVARRVHKLTSGEGQALLMALVAVGLNGGDSAIPALSPDDLAAWTAEELRRRLVDGPLVDETPEGRVLMHLAHLYHGLDAPMLAQLGLPATADYERRLAGLHDRPYVKYHPDAGVVRLHDYFADRARKLFAVHQDPDLTVRRGWSRKLVPYLAKQVQAAGETPSPRADRLRQQWLYHLLFAEPGGDYGELWETFDQSWHAGRYDYMDALLAMVRGVNEIWGEVGRFDPVLARLEQSARAWMLLEVWEEPRENIVALTDEILADDAAGVRRLMLTAMVARGTALGDMGRPDKGNALLRRALDGYNDLLALTETAERGDAAAAADLKSEHGVATTHGIRPERYLILNTIGYNERRRSRFREAAAEFEESYNLSRKEGNELKEELAKAPDEKRAELEHQVHDNLRWQGSAATQVGTVLSYLGDTVAALNWISRGLALRRELNIPDQIAYALAAQGKVQRELSQLGEARASFLAAQEIWRDLDARRDVTAMEIELGWADAISGLLDAAEAHFAVASAACAKEDGLGGLLPDLRAKQGQTRLMRARRERDAAERHRLLDEAEMYLQEAIELAEKKTQPLYAAISLAALARADVLRGRFDRLPEWAARMEAYSAEAYEFGPAFADMEQALGDAAMWRARLTGGDYDPNTLDEAINHYVHMFAHLARHSRLRYRERRQFLREWLLGLPPQWREQAGQRFIESWGALPRDPKAPHDKPEAQPGSLAEAFPGLVSTVEFICEM